MSRSGVVILMPVAAQHSPGRGVGVGLVGDHLLGAFACPAGARAGKADVVEQRHELGIVVGLARTQPDRQRASPPIDGQLHRGGQPAAGPPDCFAFAPVRLPVFPFFRSRPAPAAC